jgi:hypothetical protein
MVRQPREGVRFQIALPVSGAVQVAEFENPATALPPPSRSSKLLVIDDEPGIPRVLARLLRRDGHCVVAVDFLALLPRLAVTPLQG